MKLAGLVLAAILIPGLAFAGQITLFNASPSPIELRAVRAGVVKIAPGEAKTFLYPAENGDFRVWMAENACEYTFLFEASEDAKLQLIPGPSLHRLPSGATAPMEVAALRAAQPAGWPLLPPELFCDK